jgi:HK97 family phage major capsid protein
MLNSVELREAINKATVRAKEIVDLCKTEVREMTEEEDKEFKSLREEIDAKKAELKALEDKLAEYERELPEEEEEKEECNRKKSNRNKMTTQQILENRFKKGIEDGLKEFNLNGTEKRAVQVTGNDGVHDAVVETEFADILMPLYANSIINKLGVTYRSGLPKGDYHYPKMTKGTVGFVGEIDPAVASGNGFSYITLRPHRIAAYVDVSEMTLKQDTIGVFRALQEDLLNKYDEYLNTKFFGSDAATDNAPAGIFYNVTPTEITTYKDLCDFEADLEENNVTGTFKYALSPKAKAYLRSTIKGTNATGMILEYNEVDGTPFEISSVVPSKQFVYGNWKDVVLATWGEAKIKIDDSIGYANGLIRVYLTSYVDWAVLRPEALAFGEVKEAGE